MIERRIMLYLLCADLIGGTYGEVYYIKERITHMQL